MHRRLVPVAAAAMVLSGLSMTSAYAAPVSAGDSMFVKAAHQGNLAEIAAGQDARKNATTACVKKVGAVLVRDHTKLDADVKALAAKLNVKLPGAPTPEQKKQLAAVRAKAGTPAYDKAWLKVQEAAHTATLALIDKELSVGQNAEVKAAARSARPVVAMHWAMCAEASATPARTPARSGPAAAGTWPPTTIRSPWQASPVWPAVGCSPQAGPSARTRPTRSPERP